MKKKAMVVGFVLCAFVILFFWLLANHVPISKDTYDGIRLGMAEDDVAAFVGISHRTPATRKDRGDVVAKQLAEQGNAYFKGEQVHVDEREDGIVLFTNAVTGKLSGKVRTWDSNRFSLVVVFDPQGKVMGKTLYEYLYNGDSWLGAIRHWLAGFV